MWENIENRPAEEPKKTLYFLEWMEEYVLRPEVLGEAEQIITTAEKEAAEIKRFRSTPESPPWHSEGITVWHHVRRILAGAMAVINGADLLEIEEFAREKDLHEEIDEITRTIRENAGSMLTFALVHDIAKPDTVWFESPANSKGARAGILQHGYRDHKIADENERQHVLKLMRAFGVQNGIEEADRLSTAFFDAYEIKSHYTNHDRVGSSETYRHVREIIGGMYHLSADDLVVLNLAIKHHIDFLDGFGEGPNVAKFRLLEQRANRAGIDADDFLDLLLAFTFLDTTIGSLGYEDGEFFGRTEIIINFLRSEYEAAPRRRVRREEQIEIHERRKKKAALRAAELSSEDIFSLLGTPFGPQRGEVMKKIQQALEDPSYSPDFGRHSKELHRRIEQARRILTEHTRP